LYYDILLGVVFMAEYLSEFGDGSLLFLGTTKMECAIRGLVTNIVTLKITMRLERNNLKYKGF